MNLQQAKLLTEFCIYYFLKKKKEKTLVILTKYT